MTKYSARSLDTCRGETQGFGRDVSSASPARRAPSPRPCCVCYVLLCTTLLQKDGSRRAVVDDAMPPSPQSSSFGWYNFTGKTLQFLPCPLTMSAPAGMTRTIREPAHLPCRSEDRFAKDEKEVPPRRTPTRRTSYGVRVCLQGLGLFSPRC